MTALLLLASLLTAAQTSGPRAPLRAPFAISTTFPRAIPLSVPLSPMLAVPSVVPKLTPAGTFVVPHEPAVTASAQLDTAVNAPGDGAPFDGGGGPPAVAAVAQDGLPPYLNVPDPADRVWISDTVNVARGTKTGARILAEIEKLAQQQKRPLTVVVAPLGGNNGEYVYDWDIVRMNSTFRKLDPFSAAPIFMHELQHVLQKVEGYPVDALELELEAYLVSLRMYEELGSPPAKGSFDQQLARRLKKSAEAFVSTIADSYKGNRLLGDGGLRGFKAAVQKEIAKRKRGIERLEKRLAKEKANVQGMRAGGLPDEHVNKYEEEIIGELSRKILGELTSLAWSERDLRLLENPEDAQRYRKYAERVRRAVRAAAGR